MTQVLPVYTGKEVLMLTVDYPPGGADPVHRHDAHGLHLCARRHHRHERGRR
jgi:hypothetical protein